MIIERQKFRTQEPKRNHDSVPVEDQAETEAEQEETWVWDGVEWKRLP